MTLLLAKLKNLGKTRPMLCLPLKRLMRFFFVIGLLAGAGTGSPGTQQLPVTAAMEFVRVEPGQFMMGCSAGDSQCNDDEKPAHRVRITKGFEIGKHEVTQTQWQTVMGTNPSNFKAPDRPVEQMTFDDMQEFLQKLNARQDGYRYRLPTEAEWEYAARAGTTEPYAGSLNEVGWYNQNSGSQTHPAGQKQPNAWGIYDMHGNVWEWVQDWYSANYYRSSPAADPAGPSGGEHRILRGGSWVNAAAEARVSLRSRSLTTPLYVYNSLGFRCARETVQ